MGTIDIVAVASQVGAPNQGTLTAGSYLRVVSATIVFYEYVARRIYSTVVATYIRPVILSHSLPNFGYSRLQIDVGKTVDARMRGSCFDRNAPAE
jgi:hypothetical protein